MDIGPLLSAIQRGDEQDQTLLKRFIELVGSNQCSIEDATTWLKAVHEHGCHANDVIVMTQAMIESGAQLTWPEPYLVVDKHSTGGVGDKMSIILAPALAACGLTVPMLAGRGLGHTGGTIDKLEAIPGFNCSLSAEDMQHIARKVGCCIAVQNDTIAPADAVLYSIRDVTQTIDSVPLITASIISKKAAEGLHALVLDVKCGSAAFMKTKQEARELAQSMVTTAKGLGIKTIAQLTHMDEPIGTHVGNALEIVESVLVLKGEGSTDTRELVVLQGAALLQLTNPDLSEDDARQRIETVLDNGDALEKFGQMCVAQGVVSHDIERLVSSPEGFFPTSEFQTTVVASSNGYVQSINAMKLAELARHHGAGRLKREDVILPEVGFEIHAHTGQVIQQGELLLTFHHAKPLTSEEKTECFELVQVNTSSQIVPHRLIEIVN